MSEQQPSEHDRRLVLEGAAQLLGDGVARKAKDIASELSRLGAWVDKSLVNSVLSREGKAQFSYDRASFTYRLSGSAPVADTRTVSPTSEGDTTTHERGAVLAAVKRLLSDGAPRTAKEITALLRERGFSGLDKSLVNSVLAKEGKDDFAYDRASYQYRLANVTHNVESTD